MSYVKEFFKQNGAYVMSVIIFFLTCLTLFSILGVNFEPIPNHHIKKIVTLESFDSAIAADGACKTYLSDPDKLDKWCQNLSPKNCNVCSYCVLLNGIKCAGGDHQGPTFSKRAGEKVDYAYYHHKGTCKGNCPSN